jgi:glycosyltransferase involved in cell wall biosynthesis
MAITEIAIDRSLIQTEEEMLIRWGKFDKPLVSIHCMTYNHEKYISDALDGFLIQKTDFPFEILVHDDASTDETADIIREYEKRDSNIIKPIYQTVNQKSQGVKPSPKFNLPRAQGKYIAACEGDDYWTDPLKLQKQVDFLEANADFAMVFHNALVMEDIELTGKNFLPHLDKSVFDTEDTLYPFRSFAPTASILFRNNLITQFPDWYYSCAFGDRVIFTMLSKHGKIKYLDFIGSIRRIHPGGISSGFTKLSNTLNRIIYFKNMPSYLGEEFRPLCNRYLKYFYDRLIWCYFSNQLDNCSYVFSIMKGLKYLFSPTYLSLLKVKNVKNEKNFIKLIFFVPKKIVSKFKKEFISCLS